MRGGCGWPSLHQPLNKKAGSTGAGLFFIYRLPIYLMSKGTINRATMFTTLIMGLMAGPAVSL